MSWANVVTFLRAAVVGPLVWAILTERWSLALALFIFGVATDILDGWVARRERPTLLGQLLDPFADKLFYFALCLGFFWVERLPLLAVALFLIPQVGLGIGTVVLWRRKAELQARWPGKAAAGLTALASGLLFLTPKAIWVYWAAIAAQFGAGVYYLVLQAKGKTPEVAEPEIPASRSQ